MDYKKGWKTLQEVIHTMCIVVAKEECEGKEVDIEGVACYHSKSKAFGCLCTLIPLMQKMEKRNVTDVTEAVDILFENLDSKRIECIDPEE